MSVLIFDGECGFCRRRANWLRDHAVRDLQIIAWQEADLASLTLTAEQCQQRVQWIDGSHQASGGAAIARCLQGCRQPWKTMGSITWAKELALQPQVNRGTSQWFCNLDRHRKGSICCQSLRCRNWLSNRWSGCAQDANLTRGARRNRHHNSRCCWSSAWRNRWLGCNNDRSSIAAASAASTTTATT